MKMALNYKYPKKIASIYMPQSHKIFSCVLTGQWLFDLIPGYLNDQNIALSVECFEFFNILFIKGVKLSMCTYQIQIFVLLDYSTN